MHTHGIQKGFAPSLLNACLLGSRNSAMCADLVSPEGCFIVDDWSIINCRRAVEGFFRDHGLQPEIIHIDKNGAYFCIDKRITLQHKVYEDFNAARTE